MLIVIRFWRFKTIIFPATKRMDVLLYKYLIADLVDLVINVLVYTDVVLFPFDKVRVCCFLVNCCREKVSETALRNLSSLAL